MAADPAGVIGMGRFVLPSSSGSTMENCKIAPCGLPARLDGGVHTVNSALPGGALRRDDALDLWSCIAPFQERTAGRAT